MNRIRRFIRKLISPFMIVGTHDGRFHCDEVLACTLLTHYTEKFKGAKIVRSRDPKVWETCDALVDVGGKYQPPNILDHHQIQFQGTYPNHSVRLSSAGLVYMHYPEIIPNIINQIIEDHKERLPFKPVLTQEISDDIREKIYKNFIIYVDANDNGIDKVHDKQFVSVPTTLWGRVGKLNPMWWDETSNEMELFQKAMEIAREEIYTEVKQSFLGSVQTKEVVKAAFLNRKQAHPSGKIVLLEKYVPWQKSIVQVEEESKCPGEVLFVVFPQKSGKKWRIQAVAAQEGSFDLRKGLKEEWRGIKDMEKLVQLSGIEDIDFVHASGFIGGAVSLKSAIRMGEESF